MSQALMVGYLQTWSYPGVTFTQAAEKGYTAIVLAFGKIEGTAVSILNLTPEQLATLGQDIADAKAAGAKQIILSVGGENNTYNPNGASVNELAQAIVDVLNEYGFTGFDFDLEIDTDAEYLDQLCAELKNIGPSIMITAAPQVNQNPPVSPDLYLVSTGHLQIYNTAVANKRFDYLFIQNYNNGYPSLDGKTQLDVEFISLAFASLKNSIPAETMITIGEPANKDAAGTSVFTGPEGTNPEIYNLIADQYRAISEDPQCGGAMVWSINLDQTTQYQFVDTIGPVFAS